MEFRFACRGVYEFVHTYNYRQKALVFSVSKRIYPRWAGLARRLPSLRPAPGILHWLVKAPFCMPQHGPLLSPLERRDSRREVASRCQ